MIWAMRSARYHSGSGAGCAAPVKRVTGQEAGTTSGQAGSASLRRVAVHAKGRIAKAGLARYHQKRAPSLSIHGCGGVIRDSPLGPRGFIGHKDLRRTEPAMICGPLCFQGDGR